MNLAIIGSGGREHAICFKLRQSNKIKNLFCIPGNAGTSEIAENIQVNISDFEEIYKEIKKNSIDIVLIGPEQPLVDGIVDFLNERNVKVFGPNKFASQLEGSKSFMKNLCKTFKIPTAKFEVFDNLEKAKKFIDTCKTPIVVKADGLAAGKGVAICKTSKDALVKTKEIIEGKFASSRKVVLEEFLEGEELSYFVVVDNNSYQFFGSAQDHKRVGEGDSGPNTGGMGAYSPAKILTKSLEKKINKKIIEPTLSAIKQLGSSYKGFLYAGLMIKDDEPYLIEYNIRMGDPECQVIMLRLENDLTDIILHTLKDSLDDLRIKWKEKECMTIVLCAKGYPGDYIKDSEIKNLSDIEINSKSQIFHAGTYKKDKKIFSSGGRVLNITCSGKDLLEAREYCIENLEKINWKSGFYRKDIGWRAIKK
tara:strand:- start:1823 stop:3088 length:1266 start_codon:yes stop_codon:yes gene_type:complete